MSVKVSILIPCYNVEKYLPQCLDSVTGQTYRDLQIVVVDDGSSDGTLPIADNYAAKDSRIEIHHQENQGVAAARNNLLSRIEGEYFLFVDADDWIELDMVEYLVGIAQTHSSEIAMCGRVINDAPVSRVLGDVKVLDKIAAVRDFLRHEYFNGSLCNKLISSNVIGKERFRNDISYGEDALFVWHVLQNVKSVAVSDKQLYHYRMNEQSISHQIFDNRKFSGHIVWETISFETKKLYPEFYDIALAHWAYGDTHLLRAAVKSGCKDSRMVNLLKETVRNNWKYYRREYETNVKWIVYSWIVCRCSPIAKIY